FQWCQKRGRTQYLLVEGVPFWRQGCNLLEAVCAWGPLPKRSGIGAKREHFSGGKVIHPSSTVSTDRRLADPCPSLSNASQFCDTGVAIRDVCLILGDFTSFAAKCSQKRGVVTVATTGV